jgi:hypothetical protein
MNDWTNLEVVLKFLVGGGASVVVMYMLSLLAENWTGWHTLPKWLKFTLPLLLSALIAVGSQVLLGYADVINLASPWYTIIVVAITSYIGSQKAYMSTKASGYGANAPQYLEIIEEDDTE